MTRGELITELAVTTGTGHEARFIVEDVVGATKVTTGDTVTDLQIEAARAMAARRAAGEPLQYILGHWAFRTLDLVVDGRVLIPRPETEQVVEVALGEIRHLGRTDPVIVDAGTGSGAIALSLATELAVPCPGGVVWAIDASSDALGVAAANLERVRSCHDPLLPVTFAGGSWLQALPAGVRRTIDVLVANPPYIDADEWDSLPTEVRLEPRRALISGPATDGTPGLGDVEKLLGQGWDWLARPGAVVIELAPHQAEPAAALARDLGYREVRVEPDMAGRPRALVARVA